MQNLFCTAPVCHHDNPWFQEFESLWCTSRHPPGFQGGVCTKAVRGYRECWQVCLSDNNLYMITHYSLHYCAIPLLHTRQCACVPTLYIVCYIRLANKNGLDRLFGLVSFPDPSGARESRFVCPPPTNALQRTLTTSLSQMGADIMSIAREYVTHLFPGVADHYRARLPLLQGFIFRLLFKCHSTSSRSVHESVVLHFFVKHNASVSPLSG